MQVFKIKMLGREPSTVFAVNRDHAAALFVTAYYATCESMPDDFQITRWPWGDSTEDAHLREALDGGRAPRGDRRGVVRAPEIPWHGHRVAGRGALGGRRPP